MISVEFEGRNEESVGYPYLAVRREVEHLSENDNVGVVVMFKEPGRCIALKHGIEVAVSESYFQPVKKVKLMNTDREYPKLMSGVRHSVFLIHGRKSETNRAHMGVCLHPGGSGSEFGRHSESWSSAFPDYNESLVLENIQVEDIQF